MALTPAERMKRYREKLKQNPEKHEKIKKKHTEYVKTKTKKIEELTEQEKEKQRKIWRNQKSKQKYKKNQLELPKKKDTQETKNDKKQKKRNILMKKYRSATTKIENLTKTVYKYKKRLYRQKIETEKKVRKLEEEILKLQARDEILEASLKKAFKDSKTVKEKQTIKKIVLNEDGQRSLKKTYVSKLLGLKGLARIKHKNSKQNKARKEIETFYVRDDVSRITAGKRQCRTLQKRKEQIRYLTDTVFNLHCKYREEGGKYGYTTFFKNKPFFVISPTIQNRETCLCIKHNNFELLFHALKKYKILINFNTVQDILKNQCCSIHSKDCMYGQCNECKGNKVTYEQLLQENKDDLLKWSQWGVIEHKYKKTENKITKELTTKKTVKLQKEGNREDLVQAFERNINLFKIHHFNWIYQQKQYQECVNNLNPQEAVIICDFSENYGCKLGEEIQATHFGASKSQITLHTGMIYWPEKSQSFCTISDNNCHEPAAIWAHLLPVIGVIKNSNPETKVLHFHSDGPTSQYRQKKNFYLLNIFTEKLRLDYSTWSYSEAGHGKGVADGIGGSVKRALDRQVAFGRDVENGSQAFELLSQCMKVVKIIYIPDSDIENIKKIIPENLSTLIGTMKIHQIISHTLNTIQYRSLSCFCGIQRGTCDCFGPKTHIFKRTIQNTITPEPDVEMEADMESLGVEIIFPGVMITNDDAENLPEAQMKTHKAEMISAGGSITNNDAENLPEAQMKTHEAEMIFAGGSITNNDAENLPEAEMKTYEAEMIFAGGSITNNDAENLPEAETQSLEAKIISNGQKIENESPVPKKAKIRVLDIRKVYSNINKLAPIKTETQYKSLKTIIKRTLPCRSCKKHYLFNTYLTKCTKCQLFYCSNCIGNLKTDVYVCEICQ